MKNLRIDARPCERAARHKRVFVVRVPLAGAGAMYSTALARGARPASRSRRRPEEVGGPVTGAVRGRITSRSR